MTRAVAVILAAWLALAAKPAAAQFSDASVTCALSGTPLNFGIYNSASHAPEDVTATLTVTCTTPRDGPVSVSGTLTLSPGTSGPPVIRHVTRQGVALRYQVYADAGHQIVWGNGSGRGAAIPISGTLGRNQPLRLTFIVHGRLMAEQGWAWVGAYQGFLVVTLSY